MGELELAQEILSELRRLDTRVVRLNKAVEDGRIPVWKEHELLRVLQDPEQLPTRLLDGAPEDIQSINKHDMAKLHYFTLFAGFLADGKDTPEEKRGLWRRLYRLWTGYHYVVESVCARLVHRTSIHDAFVYTTTLDRLLGALWSEVEWRSTSNMTSFNSDVPGECLGVPAWAWETRVDTCPGMIFTLARNCIANPYDHTELGARHIQVWVRLEYDIGDNVVRILISDDGVGMTRDMLGQIFTPGFTATRKGTGRGLGDAPSLLRSMGANLRFQTQAEGQGAWEFDASRPAGEEIFAITSHPRGTTVIIELPGAEVRGSMYDR